MWPLFIFGFPILEVWVIFKVGDRIGFANSFFALLASAVFGFGLIRAQGFQLLQKMQVSLIKGETPSKHIFHSIAILLAGAFFIFPGYISDVVGLLLLLPGTRHIAVKLMQRKFAQKMRDGTFRFQGFGAGFGGDFGSGFTSRQESSMRDVSPIELDESPSKTIIDVTPQKPTDSSEDHDD